MKEYFLVPTHEMEEMKKNIGNQTEPVENRKRNT